MTTTTPTIESYISLEIVASQRHRASWGATSVDGAEQCWIDVLVAGECVWALDGVSGRYTLHHDMTEAEIDRALLAASAGRPFARLAHAA